MMIPATQMMEGDADLQNPLVETPHLTRLGPPQQFKGLVLLEVLAAIELPNPLEQLRRGDLVTFRHLSWHHKEQKARPGDNSGTGLIASDFVALRFQKSNCALNFMNRAERSELGRSHAAPLPL
jgi:hypothetical protein